MGKNNSRIRNIVAAVIFATAVITFVQVTSARPIMVSDAGPSNDLLLRADPAADSCLLTINVQGGGAVDLLQEGAAVERLSEEANEIRAGCNELVELTVMPKSGYRFVAWQGVPEALQLKHTIKINTPAQVTAVFAPRKIVRYETLQTPFVDRGGRLVTEVPIMESVWRTLPDDVAIDTVAPVINVWYGETQAFGERGTPQKWANVLGNVSDADGDLSKLEYKLNGVGPTTLNVGGDGHRGDGLRLYSQGDFNIDIDNSLLVSGSNTVEIIATDSQGQTSRFVTIVQKTGNVWTLPYGINWGAASSIQNVTQIVDGKWSKTAAGVRPVELGFDRILAIGEMDTWSDFEMTVPVTVHGYSEEGFSPSQNHPAMDWSCVGKDIRRPRTYVISLYVATIPSGRLPGMNFPARLAKMGSSASGLTPVTKNMTRRVSPWIGKKPTIGKCAASQSKVPKEGTA